MVEISTTYVYTLKEARCILGLSRKQLAERSSIAISTIIGIENSTSPYRTHIGVAIALAEALGLEVYELQWPHGLSHIGRPPHTGKPITRKHLTLVHSSPSVEQDIECCSSCNLALPVVGICDYCQTA